MSEDHTAKRHLTPEARARKMDEVLILYGQRVPIYTIAEKTGLRPETVHSLVAEGVELLKNPDPARESVKDLLLIESMIRALVPDALKGNTNSHGALNRWVERRSKMLGLDRPDKVEAIVTQFNGSIEDEERELLRRLGLSKEKGTDDGTEEEAGDAENDGA